MTGTATDLGDRLAGAGVEGISFDLFGTLLTVEQPPDPSEAVASALSTRGVAVPEDWESAYRTVYIDAEPLEEIPLGDHVLAVLRAHADERTEIPSESVVAEALMDAFDTPIETRDGAIETVESFAEHVPVAILSNSSVSGLVEWAIGQSALDANTFASIYSSVELGWRKPHERTFAEVAAGLGVDLDALVHVGDDARTDGGASRAGAHAVVVSETGPLTVESVLAAEGWPA